MKCSSSNFGETVNTAVYSYHGTRVCDAFCRPDKKVPKKRNFVGVFSSNYSIMRFPFTMGQKILRVELMFLCEKVCITI